MDSTRLEGASSQRALGVRVLLMLFSCIAFQLAASVLLAVAVVQLLLAALAAGPNERLRDFGAAIGRYLAQIAGFVAFRSEDAPFPFSDWPAA